MTKCVILAGGVGSRLFEETEIKPKPLVEIAKKPIIFLIIKYLLKKKIFNFYICLGYKGELIIDFFIKISKKIKSEFNSKKKIIFFKEGKLKGLKIKFIKTGLKTGTGGRLLKIKNNIDKNENFLMVYGDGIHNVNVNKLLDKHSNSNKIATMTIVRPKNRFGLAYFKKNSLVSFNERKNIDKTSQNWINAGIFCLNEKVFNFIDKSSQFFEEQPLQKLIKKRQINIFKHTSFWACMDTLKDKIDLEKKWKNREFNINNFS